MLLNVEFQQISYTGDVRQLNETNRIQLVRMSQCHSAGHTSAAMHTSDRQSLLQHYSYHLVIKVAYT